jgi:hypothetical protein
MHRVHNKVSPDMALWVPIGPRCLHPWKGCCFGYVRHAS